MRKPAACLLVIVCGCIDPADQDSGDPADGSGGGSDGTGGLGSGSGSGSGGTTNAAPLPPTTFVFATAKALGQSKLYSYDVLSRTTTTVSDLDGHATVEGVALSHDRRTIAFTGMFRAEQSDVDLGYPADMLWIASSDGTTFKRVTPTLPKQTPLPGSSYMVTMESPVWSPDDASIFIALGQVWINGTTIGGGTIISRVAATGGFPTAWSPGNAGCQHNGPVDFSADGSAVFRRDICYPASNNGLYRYAGGSVTQLVQNDSLTGKPELLPDGAGVLVPTYGGLAAIATPSGTMQGIIAPPVAGARFEEVAMDPAGRYIATCVIAGSTRNLYLLDLAAAQPAWALLPNLIDSACAVAW
jgi:hypothetical protein